MLLPFSIKPYNVDDSLSVNNALSLLEGNPLGFSVRGPFTTFYLAFFYSVFGESEFVSHLSLFLFSLILLFSVYFLSQKFLKSYSVIPSLLLLSSASFFLLSNQVMSDLILVSLFTLSLTFFVFGIDRNSKPLLFLSFVSGFAAVLSKYYALLLIPLFLLYIFLNKKTSKANIAFSFSPILALMFWALYTRFFIGQDFVSKAASLYGFTFSFSKIFETISSNTVYLGATFVFPLFLIYFSLKKERHLKYFALLSLILALASAFFLLPSISSLQWTTETSLLFYLFFFFSGAVFVLPLLHDFINHAKNFLDSKLQSLDYQNFFLLFWFFLLFAAISFLEFGHSRYLLIALIPAILLFSQKLESFNLKKPAIAAVVLSTLFLSLLLAVQDYSFADSYKNFSSEIQQKYPDSNIWYYSNWWGFDYYMKKNPKAMLVNVYNTCDSYSYSKKDLIAVPKNFDSWYDYSTVPPSFLEFEEIYSKKYSSNSIEVASSSFWRAPIVPYIYSFKENTLEEFHLYRVKDNNMFFPSYEKIPFNRTGFSWTEEFYNCAEEFYSRASK